LNASLILKFFKSPADHVNTDAGAFAQYIGHAENTGKIIYGIMNYCRFHAARLIQAAQSFFNFPVSGFEYKTDKINVLT